MKDKLQTIYNHFIRMANLMYVQSQEPLYAEHQTSLLSKAEAYESDAEYFYNKFPDEITPTVTMRWNDIREHHLSEDETEPKQKAEA